MWVYPIDGSHFREVLSMSDIVKRMEYTSHKQNKLTNVLFCHDYEPGELCSPGSFISWHE